MNNISEISDQSQSILMIERNEIDNSLRINDEVIDDFVLSQTTPVVIKPKFPGPAGYLTPQSKVFTLLKFGKLNR